MGYQATESDQSTCSATAEFQTFEIAYRDTQTVLSSLQGPFYDRVPKRYRGKSLVLVSTGLNGGLALSGIGGIVSFVVGAAGFGAVLRQYLG